MLTQPLVVAGKTLSLAGKAPAAVATPVAMNSPAMAEPSVTATAAVTCMARRKEQIGWWQRVPSTKTLLTM
jgi:hypothetical protein